MLDSCVFHQRSWASASQHWKQRLTQPAAVTAETCCQEAREPGGQQRTGGAAAWSILGARMENDMHMILNCKPMVRSGWPVKQHTSVRMPCQEQSLLTS